MSTRRNTDRTTEVVMREYTILLRSVAVTMRATEMLYVAADMLVPVTDDVSHGHNRAVVKMVARLLGLPTNDPEMVERVLRNLPNLTDPTRESE